MKQVLVTGGAGYVGSHACKVLAGAGFTPVTYDDLERGHAWAVKWGPLERGNLLDSARLGAVFRSHEIAAVMHFAAYAYVGESVEQPGRYYHNNVAGTLTLLEAMRNHGIDALVFSSTCAIYGMPESVPIKESHPQAPISPYGASKQMIERILRDYAAAYGLRSISLRYFNAAGADPEGEIGEAHDPETHLIPLLLDTAAGRRPNIDIYGDDYETPDGTCIRDYIHVSDLADAHVKALKRLLEGGDIGFYNLGNGAGHSVKEVIEAARHITGREIATAIVPRRPGDPPALVADASEAARVLGWRPERADVNVQMADAWRWHQSHFAT